MKIKTLKTVQKALVVVHLGLLFALVAYSSFIVMMIFIGYMLSLALITGVEVVIKKPIDK